MANKKQSIKLYLAILNKGWIRRELITALLQWQRTPGVTLMIENLSKTFAHPIDFNRNKITERFLMTDYEYLMMIDCDVVPMHNPCELVFANKDIIGSPAKVRQKGRAINWVAYVEHREIPGAYVPVDFSRVDNSVDLLKVDIVGTGCILVRRNVLEHFLKLGEAPWTCERSDDGWIYTYGTDFSFCRRAKREGFEIFTTPQRICEHIKELGLLDIQGYDDSDNIDLSNAKYKIPWGDYAISQKDWHFIKEIINKNKIKTVLEFGSGLSSFLMSEMAEVDSFDTNKKYIEDLREQINSNKLTLIKWDGKNKPRQIQKKYDLAFVDGPVGIVNGGMGRQHSIRIASKYADRIIIHDAGRTEETRWQNKYLRNRFKLKKRSGWHQSRCHYWERI